MDADRKIHVKRVRERKSGKKVRKRNAMRVKNSSQKNWQIFGSDRQMHKPEQDQIDIRDGNCKLEKIRLKYK